MDLIYNRKIVANVAVKYGSMVLNLDELYSFLGDFLNDGAEYGGYKIYDKNLCKFVIDGGIGYIDLARHYHLTNKEKCNKIILEIEAIQEKLGSSLVIYTKLPDEKIEELSLNIENM